MTIEERIDQDAAQWRDGLRRAARSRRYSSAPWLHHRVAGGGPGWQRLRPSCSSPRSPPSPRRGIMRSTRTQTAPGRRRTAGSTHSLRGLATVQVPARWYSTPYRGIAPATVYFPLTFFSTRRFSGPCFDRPPPSACASPSWFPNGCHHACRRCARAVEPRRVPGNVGSGSEARAWAARRDRPSPRESAFRRRGLVPIRCRDRGRCLRSGVWAYPGERFDMTACLGPHVTRADRAAVYTMLRSLQIRSR